MAQAQTQAHAGGPADEGIIPARVQVPGYEVLELLGKGGMGVVYKARQVALNRVVALKMILHAEHAGPAERQRFQVEAEAMARLQHPNIVQVFEVGSHDGLPFLTLEYCSGGSLAQRLDGTPWPVRESARLVQTLADAAHAAHAAHVVHRDLNPANVLLTATGQPKIADFGLAKKLGQRGRTQTGAVVGTPSYMAPEQASGKGKEVGPAADIYALGAILYELLTGRPLSRRPLPWTRSCRWSPTSRCRCGGHGGKCRAIWRRFATSAWRRILLGVTPARRAWPRTCGISCLTNRSEPDPSLPGNGG